MKGVYMSEPVSGGTVNLCVYLRGNSVYEDGRCLTAISLDYGNPSEGYFVNIKGQSQKRGLTQLPIGRMTSLGCPERLSEILSIEIEKVKSFVLKSCWAIETRSPYFKKFGIRDISIELKIPRELKSGSTYCIILVVENIFHVTASFSEQESVAASSK